MSTHCTRTEMEKFALFLGPFQERLLANAQEMAAAIQQRDQLLKEGWSEASWIMTSVHHRLAAAQSVSDSLKDELHKAALEVVSTSS